MESVKHRIRVFEHEFDVYDKPNSQTPFFVARELNADPCGLNEVKDEKLDLVVDVGANTGIFSVYCSKMFPDATIHAIEPWPDNYENLCKTLEENKCKNVTPHNFAITGQTRPMTLGEPQNNSGATSFIFAALDAKPIAGLSIKDFMNEIIPGKDIDFLKLDVERMEYEIIAGFNEWTRIKHLSVELHGLFPYPPFLWRPTLNAFLGHLKNIPIKGNLWTNDIDSL